MKGLILAQSERWRRGLGMQVERETGGQLPGVKRRKGEEYIDNLPRGSGQRLETAANTGWSHGGASCCG